MRMALNFNLAGCRMRMRVGALLSSVASLVVLAGCPVENQIPPPPNGEEPVQCSGTGYTAFDVANHAEQDARVGAYTEIKALLEAAVEEPELAAARFVEAQAIYTETAELAGKVEGRTDDHLDGRPNVGAEVHARIAAAFADGAGATTSLEAAIAAETIDKALTEFFFLSVYHELVQGQADKWDEAFGYFGAPADNDLTLVQGFASVANRRDLNNGTALEAAIFQGLVDGSCTLAQKLAEQGVETVDVLNDEEMRAHIDAIDVAMREVLAYSVGHEAFVIGEVQQAVAAAPDEATANLARDEARIALVELDGFFRPLERLMLAEGEGDDGATGATGATIAGALRAEIDAGLDDDTGAWVDAFDATGVIERIETHFEIDVIE